MSLSAPTPVPTDICTLSHPTGELEGVVKLDGSKSLTNRALIIQALCKESFEIHHGSTSDDSTTLTELLASQGDTYDAGHGGTTLRFLTAYLAVQKGTQLLTGSKRLCKRPIGALVDALREIGARIDYEGLEGYPPLRIHPFKEQSAQAIEIDAGVSSQFISALLLIAPILPKGLHLTLTGERVMSKPYIDMTLHLMRHFGVAFKRDGRTVDVRPGAYKAKDIYIEADWSAASYYYAMAALADSASLELHGLKRNSFQGDAIVQKMLHDFGIQTKFTPDGIRIKKKFLNSRRSLEWNFEDCPDLAQTIVVLCAGLNIMGLFYGMQTLHIKETDRIAALQQELRRFNVSFVKMPERFSKEPGREYYMLEGRVNMKTIMEPVATYNDHRMALSFAPLALLGDVRIENPAVVSKSYPQFWEHLESLGFEVEYGERVDAFAAPTATE